jgi:hypothetical protein
MADFRFSAGGQIMTDRDFVGTVRHNCDISDARDNGIYSICMLVLKLRNLYKWEHDIEPWEEPESKQLLDWIDAKENYWEKIIDEPYQSFFKDGSEVDSYDVAAANRLVDNEGLVYGAGYGRSLKSIFFLAEKIREESAEGCRVVILGREKAKELSSPFAMLQDSIITIRREPLRFFFWDHIQEIRSSNKTSLYHALDRYDVLVDGQLNQDRFRDRLDDIVDGEISMFIYHEVGEMLQDSFDSHTLRKVIAAFPDSAIEYVSRAVKDVLADTHPQGMVSYIIREQREASLGFYVGFLAGLRRELFPQVTGVFDEFLKAKDWRLVEDARLQCREENRGMAERIHEIADLIDREPIGTVQQRFNEEILVPLGLDAPEQKG